jgi:hypothetical protein
MKTTFSRIAVVLLVTLLTGGTLFAKTQKETVKFPTDIKVNGTLVTKGTYEVKFDEQTNELSIIKDKKVIARATASLEKRDSKSRKFVLRSSGSGDDTQLTGITFAGADNNILISGVQASR